MPLTLLVDDESSVRADLRAKLALHPDVVVVGEAATLGSARDLLATAKYDLVFLDVQLIGGDGFQLVPHVRAGARIIFATGYDHYAIRAFEINALDYLLKPIAPDRLAASLDRFRQSVAAPPEDHQIYLTPGTELRKDDVICLREGARARFTAVDDISLIISRDNYSEVFFVNGSQTFLRRSLKSWEEALPAAAFCRVHRTAIVNLPRILRYERDREERTLLFIEGVAEPVPVSRYRWNEVQDRLARLRPAI